MPDAYSSSQDSSVLVETDGTAGVSTITLNRPSRRNALHAEMLSSLDKVVSAVACDESVRAIVLTGSGNSFCSGVDTDELAGGPNSGAHTPGSGGPEALRRGFDPSHCIILNIFSVEKPVIAAVHGPPIPTRLAKTMMHRSFWPDLASALQMSAAAEAITLSSADHAEGMAAAREKRAPEFRGV